MPQIPTFTTSPGSVPSTSGSLPRANMDVRAPTDPFGQIAAAGDIASRGSAAAATLEASAFATTARAGEKVSEAGDAFAQQYINAKMNVAAADWSADLSKKLNEAQFEAGKIPDRAKATDAFDAATTKIYDDFSTSNVNPLVRSKVDAAFKEQTVLRRSATQRQAFEGESQVERGKLIDQVDQYTKQAVEATDPRLRDSIMQNANEAIDGRVAGGWMNADTGAKMKIDFKSNVLRTQIELAMSKDLASGLKLAGILMPGLNAKDSRDIGVMANDKRWQLEAETQANGLLPVLGGGGFDNNIGNITASKASYAGGKGAPFGAPSGLTFETFQSPEHGVAAAMNLIQAKADQSGGSITFTDLIKGKGAWDKNAPDSYPASLAQSVGLKPDDVVPVNDPEKMAAILKAMNRFEKGKQTVPDDAFGRGVKLAKGDTSIVPTPPDGDELTRYRIDGLRQIQALEANTTMDPRLKAQTIAILKQRISTTNSIVLEQRKAADDEGETAAFGLFNGKYKDNTFQGLADKYKASGDNSKAAVYQFMADNESLFKDFANQPPGAQRTMAAILPGAAGKIASSIIADRRTDRTEFRRLGAEQERVFNDGLNSDVSPDTLINNAREAIQYYAAAGDAGKAKSLVEQFQGAITGHKLGQLPPAQREAALIEMRQLAESPDGLSVRDSTAIRLMQRGAAKGDERWKNDPLSINNDRGSIKLQPFDPNLDGVNMQMWGTQRFRDTTRTTLDMNPNATNVQTPFFTQSEMSQISATLDKGSLQNEQQFLAKLATAVPEQAIPLIGQQMSKNDAMSDARSAALGLYRRGKPGDTQIADGILEGVRLWQKGGADGKTRVQISPETFMQVDSIFGASRAGMPADQVTLQNNAIMARYVQLTANQPERKQVDTAKLEQAATEVVGTSMKLNGGSFILPREIAPYQFRDGIAAIQPADVASLKPAADGSVVTAEKVRRYATYESRGDGKYWVRMEDPKKGGTSILIDGNTGKPWELDIRTMIARGANNTGQVSDPARDMLGVQPMRRP